jgi:hypothetical protein
MRILTLLGLVAALIWAAPAAADEPAAEAEALMREYLRLWNAGDAEGVTTRIYRLDTPGPTSEPAGLERTFEQLRAQGYDHSELISLEACLLTETLALAEFRYTRLKTDGEPLGPRERATLYRLRKFDDGWRITELIGMDYSADLNCSSMGLSAGEAAIVEAFMAQYIERWNAHDAGAITARMYRLESENHPWRTEAGLQGEFDRLAADGYDYSEMESIRACMTGQDTADVELRFTRLRTDGTAIAPGKRASLYKARKFDDGWRITGMAAKSLDEPWICPAAN